MTRTKVDILYIDLSTLGLWDEHFRSLLTTHKGARTRVVVRHLESEQVPVSPLLPARPYYYGDLFRAIARAEDDGYDAVIIGCAADPGIRTARQMARIPVIAPLTAALHVSGLLGRRLAVLCPAHQGKRDRPLEWHEETIRMLGFDTGRVIFRLVEVEKPRPEEVKRYLDRSAIIELKEEILERYRQSILNSGVTQARLAVEEDRADVVFFACTLWGGLLEPVLEAVPVPVLDPVITSLKAAECGATVAIVKSGRSERGEARVGKKGGGQL